jgi:DNA-binding GntR family transcriptional regulator
MDEGLGQARHGKARDRFEALHATLRERICDLEYAPGERLSEAALAAEFGISRTPLRRVLARLESEGLVRAVHGVGTMVTDLDKETLAQVYRLRLGLAALYGSLEPVPPSSGLVARFRALDARAQALRSDPSAREFTRLNREVFHTLTDLTANVPLREMSEQLYFRTARIWLKSVFDSQVDLIAEIEISARESAEILVALERGDTGAVAALRHTHLALSFERLTAPGDGAA